MKTSMTLRLPDPLFKRIQEIAKKEKRSMSSQIELFIEKYLSLSEVMKNISNEDKLKEAFNKKEIENNSSVFNISPKSILNMNSYDLKELKEQIKKAEEQKNLEEI